MKITQEIMKTLENQRPIPIATSNISKDGLHSIPNLVYVSFIKVYDEETIIIADNKFYKTRMNLIENPEIAITIYNPDSNQSYQIKGTVEIYESGSIYEECVSWVHDRKPNIKTKAIIIVHIRDVYNKDKKLIINDEKSEFIKGLL